MDDVRWTIDAQEDLWGVIGRCDEDTAQEIMAAMQHADTVLRADPLDVGESRETGRRIMLVNPLTLFFRVHPEEKLVRVLAVHHWKR